MQVALQLTSSRQSRCWQRSLRYHQPRAGFPSPNSYQHYLTRCHRLACGILATDVPRRKVDEGNVRCHEPKTNRLGRMRMVTPRARRCTCNLFLVVRLDRIPTSHDHTGPGDHLRVKAVHIDQSAKVILGGCLFVRRDATPQRRLRRVILTLHWAAPDEYGKANESQAKCAHRILGDRE